MCFKVKSCGCMSLRTGGLVIGWVGIVSTVFLFALRLLTYVQTETHTEIIDLTHYYFKKYTKPNLFSTIFVIAIHGYLIVGIKQNKHSNLIPWLIFEGIFSGIMIALLAYMNVLYLIQEPTKGLMVLLLVVPAIAFIVSIWMVVFSLYKEIKEENQKPSETLLQLSHIENGQISRAPNDVKN